MNAELEILGIPVPPKVCHCHCHQHGTIAMHCLPCCHLTYQKYIDSNGVVNQSEYEKLNAQKHKERFYTNGRDMIQHKG